MKRRAILKIIVIVFLFFLVLSWKDVKKGLVDGFYDANAKHSSVNILPSDGNTFEMEKAFANLLFNF